jgi:predicted ribosome quality control (RQC) complex YloA/Tae2 family protein
MAMFGISGSVGFTDSTTTASSSGGEKSRQTTRRLSAQNEDYVNNLLRSFGMASTADVGSARSQAITDTAGAVESLFQQYKDTAIPDILTAQQKTGGYGATTSQLLSNDAYARTVGKAAELQLNTIAQYENNALNRSQQALQGLSTSLQALLQASETTDVASQFNTKSKSNTKALEAKASGSFGWGG